MQKITGNTSQQCLLAIRPEGLNPSAKAPLVPASFRRLCDEPYGFPQVAAVEKFTNFISACWVLCGTQLTTPGVQKY